MNTHKKKKKKKKKKKNKKKKKKKKKKTLKAPFLPTSLNLKSRKQRPTS
jgi:hypothetical protein